MASEKILNYIRRLSFRSSNRIVPRSNLNNTASAWVPSANVTNAENDQEKEIIIQNLREIMSNHKPEKSKSDEANRAELKSRLRIIASRSNLNNTASAWLPSGNVINAENEQEKIKIAIQNLREIMSNHKPEKSKNDEANRAELKSRLLIEINLYEANLYRNSKEVDAFKAFLQIENVKEILSFDLAKFYINKLREAEGEIEHYIGHMQKILKNAPKDLDTFNNNLHEFRFIQKDCEIVRISHGMIFYKFLQPEVIYPLAQEPSNFS